ncbi:hypothetical protein [Novosphingobium sp. FSW06-99]|uniref:cellulose biosynthesis protein BcsD n=1 Tax=Novosphingobium sp. FSW06-99 TaxID=1739113 RepID=UPI00076BC9CE|nr:hypothetical protein [Novosphingobium sp. FSW06-99]KUR74692.1 hypothetical protein AQZ49_17515 [Novosphingobium sp. FSW06-99]
MTLDLLARVRERASAPAREFGLAVLTAMTAAEVFAQASPEAARGFYLAVGRRVAGLVDLAQVHDIDALVERINALWSSCGCGHARISAVETGLKIVHSGAPVLLLGDQDHYWARLFPAMIEGAYDAWFRALGSGPALSTRILRQHGDVIELHHGI